MLRGAYLALFIFVTTDLLDMLCVEPRARAATTAARAVIKDVKRQLRRASAERPRCDGGLWVEPSGIGAITGLVAPRSILMRRIEAI
jgi:hypothetical protein